MSCPSPVSPSHQQIISACRQGTSSPVWSNVYFLQICLNKEAFIRFMADVNIDVWAFSCGPEKMLIWRIWNKRFELWRDMNYTCNLLNVVVREASWMTSPSWGCCVISRLSTLCVRFMIRVCQQGSMAPCDFDFLQICLNKETFMILYSYVHC